MNYQDLEKWVNAGNFPDLASNNYKDIYIDYPFFYNAKSEDIGTTYIKTNLIYGDNWAFLKKNRMGQYPYKTKLRDIGRALLKNEMLYGNSELPAVPVFLVGDKYYLMEGNHRFYLHKFLGIDEIRVNCTRIYYEDFIYGGELLTT